MRIFFDTEFTSLTKDAELISAGFVTEKGDSLYFERTDFDKSKSSDFVKSVVYPLLDAPLEYKWSAVESCARLVEWLDTQSSSPVLVSDSNWDIALLHELFSVYGGIKHFFPNIKFEILHFPTYLGSGAAYEIAYNDYFRLHPNKEHHALHDAKALRQGWMQMNGYYY